MIARFAPLTARRWARPAVRNSSTSLEGRPEVSPTTSAGSSPAGSGSSAVAAPRSPARKSSATRCHAGASVTSRGGPRTRSTATVNSPPRGRASVPRAVTCWPCKRSRHPAAGASTAIRPPPSRVARTSTRSIPPALDPKPLVRKPCGRLSSSKWMVTDAPCAAAARKGCPAASWTSAPIQHAATGAVTTTATAAGRHGRRTRPPRTAATNPTTSAAHHAHNSPASAVAHTANAAGTRYTRGFTIPPSSRCAGDENAGHSQPHLQGSGRRDRRRFSRTHGARSRRRKPQPLSAGARGRATAAEDGRRTSPRGHGRNRQQPSRPGGSVASPPSSCSQGTGQVRFGSGRRRLVGSWRAQEPSQRNLERAVRRV